MPTQYPHRNAIHNTSHGTACHRCIAPPPPPPPSLSPSPPPSPSPSPPSHSSCAATAPYGQATKNRRKKPLLKSWWRGFHRSLATAISARHLTSIVPLHLSHSDGLRRQHLLHGRTDGRTDMQLSRQASAKPHSYTHPPPMPTYQHRNAIRDTSHRTARHHSVTGRRHHHHHHHRHPTPAPQPHHTASQRRTSKKIIAKEVGCGAFRGRWSSAIGADTTLLGCRPHY